MPDPIPNLKVNFEDWGRIDYSAGLIRQKEFLLARQENKIPDTFVFCEHPAVVTLGRGKPKPGELPYIPQTNIPVVEVERGGLATYHGPGQLVCYPFVQLSPKQTTQFPGGIVCFIRLLENWMAKVAQHYGVPAKSIQGKTGLWTSGDGEPRKLASIGIAVSHWVTYHGLAFNFATGREVWMGFNPCGLAGEVMTDLKTEMTEDAPSYLDVKETFLATFPSLPLSQQDSCQSQ